MQLADSPAGQSLVWSDFVMSPGFGGLAAVIAAAVNSALADYMTQAGAENLGPAEPNKADLRSEDTNGGAS